MRGVCRLFGYETDLRESHIYPFFAVDYLKSSGSKYLRNFSNPNLRKQDGIKLHLLSGKAEQLFGDREKWFAENIFIPYMDKDQRTFTYDENLFYFSLSFLWRILILHTEDKKFEKESFYPALVETEKEWRLFLKDFIFPINYNKVNLFFTDRMKSNSTDLKGADYYFSRAFDGTIVTSPDGYIAVYGKFMRFVFWSVIKSDLPIEDSQLRIDPLKGQIGCPQQFQDDYITDFFMNRIRQVESLPKPSEKQQEKIEEELLRDKKGFLNSDAGKSIYNDIFNLDKDK